MVKIVAEFFMILDVDPPQNMEELIPYLLTVVISIFLASGVFRVITGIVTEMLNMRKV